METADYFTIDLRPSLRALRRCVGRIALVSLLLAALGFGIAAFLLPPRYESSVLLYVDNRGAQPDESLSMSDISAAQSLIPACRVILLSRTTLQQVLERTGAAYSVRELADMVRGEVEGDAAFLRVTVSAADPQETAQIANAIAQVLPGRVAEIISGSAVTVVDAAVPDSHRVSPSIGRYTLVGGVLGLFFSAAAAVVADRRKKAVSQSGI